MKQVFLKSGEKKNTSEIDSYPVDDVRCIMGDEELGGFDGVDDRQDFILWRINEILRPITWLQLGRGGGRMARSLTGRSEAVLSRYLMLWFSAL